MPACIYGDGKTVKLLLPKEIPLKGLFDPDSKSGQAPRCCYDPERSGRQLVLFYLIVHRSKL